MDERPTPAEPAAVAASVLQARRLVRLLSFGAPATRQELAGDLLRAGANAAETLQLLARTIHSAEPWLLRARCLEVLGLTIAGADRQTAEQILGALADAPPPARGEGTPYPRQGEAGAGQRASRDGIHPAIRPPYERTERHENDGATQRGE